MGFDGRIVSLCYATTVFFQPLYTIAIGEEVGPQCVFWQLPRIITISLTISGSESLLNLLMRANSCHAHPKTGPKGKSQEEEEEQKAQGYEMRLKETWLAGNVVPSLLPC